jgi:CPA2 family monovalent cation:H+ antiporter-2
MLATQTHELPLIATIAAAFTAAWILGIATQKLRLSPIVGYLLAGVAIGPHTPGFAGNLALAQQLSEVGVILLMFGVGLHFRLEDLLAVRNVAVPGAIGQSIATTLVGALVGVAFGLPFTSGLVLGMAMAIASTVVLTRVLGDNRVLDTTAGHVAVGWLIVQDVITVIVLVLIPTLAPSTGDAAAHGPLSSLWIALPLTFLKLAALVALLLWVGPRIIPRIMVFVARLRSRELFTLTVLVMALAIAVGSYYAFGASMALGAFLAGMVVGRSPVANQAAADALPLRDAFAVLFFAAVGMMFDPRFLIHHFPLLLAGLAVILIVNPLVAMTIVATVGYPVRTALTVALGLTQIGEFSFILSQLGKDHGLLNDTAHSLLVACSIVTITLNPLLFRTIPAIERFLQRWPALWRFLNRGALARTGAINRRAGELLESSDQPVAVIVGYGPVGRTIDDILRKTSLETVIVDLNMDTVQTLTKAGRAAIFGDAFNIEVMHQALARATYLIIALPHSTNRNPLIAATKLINPAIKIFVRARYIDERAELIQAGADAACYEEAEAAVALAKLVMSDRGADDQAIRRETTRIRQQLKTS